MSLVSSDAPILRSTVKPWSYDKPLKTLTDMLFAELVEHNGVGLAAPQVGEDAQVAVIQFENYRIIIVNPEIDKRSDYTDVSREGCLSLPEKTFEIERLQHIRLISYPPSEWADKSFKANMPRFEKIVMRASGALARVIQHEVDHLRGVCIDAVGS